MDVSGWLECLAGLVSGATNASRLRPPTQPCATATWTRPEYGGRAL